MQLPAHLRQIIDGIVKPTAEIIQAAEAVSNRYRRLQQGLAIASEDEARAYVATRLPSTYCATARVFETLPDFTPSSMLDVGAGPGTVALAAREQFPSLDNITLLEPNAHLRAIGSSLIDQRWQAGDATQIPDAAYDLVTSGYVLNEIVQEKGAEAFCETVHKMWKATRHMLVIIEPGTPSGQEVILQARDILLTAGAHMVAPCPHALACPVAARWRADEKWCHFSVRVERSRTHRQSKPDAVLGYEDEKFSYLVVSREAAALPRFRILGHPQGKKVLSLQACTADGTYQDLQVAKSHGDHKALRKASWGDGVY